MADREKVIKALNMHFRKTCKNGDCPYVTVGDCEGKLLFDALALLKEQETVEPFHKCKGKSFSLIEDNNYDYCPYCGKPITWAKQEGR